MICFNCGKKIDDNSFTCPYCNAVIKSKVKELDNTKSINKKGVILIICILLIIGLIIIGNIKNKNNSLNNKDKIVSMFCKEGKYKDNVTISNVLDNYSCPLYISYMIDTSGEALTSNNINDLIKLSDGLIFETYYYFNHYDISNVYDETIYNKEYYDFLHKNDLCNLVEESTYNNLIFQSISDDNIDLYDSILKCMSKENITFKNVDEYFGTTYIKHNNSKVSLIKSISKNPNYFNLYKKYYNKTSPYFIEIFNKELLKNIDNDKDLYYLYGMLLNNLDSLDYQDLVNYHEYGGKFYIKDIDPAKMLLSSLKYEVSDVERKVKYIIDNAINEGYDLTYSTALDKLLYNYKNNSQNIIVYKVLKSYQFKCYDNCYYERNFR